MLTHSGLPADLILASGVQNQALVVSFNDGFRLAMVAILVGLGLVMMLRKPRSTVVPAGAQ